MSDINMTSLTNKLQNLELCLKSQDGPEVGYRRALREAILDKDSFMEVEVLKCLGDLRLKKAKLSKDPADFDKAAALYAAALLRCTDPDIRQTLEHRIGYMEKLSRQLLQGYTPHFRWLLPDYWGTADSNFLRVAEICDKLDSRVSNPQHLVENIYTETLVTAIANSDMFLELEVLKSLGDFYLEKGKKTSDVSQFPKAAAMYSKALTRCGDPETKLTLEHRIRYMEKQTSLLSEKHFAAALKKVHVRDSTAQQYQREVEPLCKLGDVYSKRGQQTGDGGDFVKAAALYNAAIARSEDQVLNSNIETAIKEVGISFHKLVLGINYKVSQDNTEKHKKQLKEMRDHIKLEMETIDQHLDPYVHNEDDPRVRQIEAKRAQAVRHLFENIAQQRKEFISLLVEECIGLMGPPPCKYALIGLGSQATGLVTPYSDLEFAILVKEESNQCLEYFRNFTHNVHLKVVNLGETILPALGIKSLNNFYSKNPLDNWYYDSVTPRGFAFDGSMPKASKTPLGRQGTSTEPPSELICTPENMVLKLQKDATFYLKERYHLATILRNPCLLAGDQDLFDRYKAITVEILLTDGGKMAQQQATLKEDMERFSDTETITARLIDVKKNIYRFPALAVDCLALSSGIIPTTVWETIDEMENQEVVSFNNAHHLTVLTSVSAELRLRTYIANGGQKENLSALASTETVLHGQESSQQHDEVQTRVKGTMFSELCKYDLAIRCYHEALKKADGHEAEKLKLLNDIGLAYHRVGDHGKAMGYHKQVLDIHRSIFGQNAANSYAAISLNNLGAICNKLGDHKTAIRYYEQALQMYKSIYGQNTAHPDIATTHNNLGGAYSFMGEYVKAISYYEQALQMLKKIHVESLRHPHIASTFNNLGEAHGRLGDYRTAVNYFQQALRMHRGIYGQSTTHPHIATSLNNVGSAWGNLGDYKKNINYCEQALQMHRSIYGQDAAHTSIASSLNNLGQACNGLGDHRKAISHYEQTLEMYRSIYGQSTPHLDVARSLNNLGATWDNLADYQKSISYYEQTLEMYRRIYGQGTAHPNISDSLNNLGSAWSNLGDYKKAINYHEQALEMRRCIYGRTTAHSDIASSLSNLGSACSDLGDHRKAIIYNEEELQMNRSIYGL
ncbi:uncharacterized protein LOC144861571 [Branchiostoma floridae x Branchiostoma japonicum]